jgi:uncharacterized membrane protein
MLLRYAVARQRHQTTIALRLLCAILILGLSPVWRARANDAVVHAVLFYSPTCSHCHQVITDTLPPLFAQYGAQLQIVGVDTTSAQGQALYAAAIEQLRIPAERQGVPLLIVGDSVLVGSLEIPERLPELIEHHLAQGGVDWPAIPGLHDALRAARPAEPAASPPPVATALPAQQAVAAPTSVPAGATATGVLSIAPAEAGLIRTEPPAASLQAHLARDPAGNALAIVVLIGMVVAVGGALIRLSSSPPTRLFHAPAWAVPALCLLGLTIAGYLAYVELLQVTALCGPVGDCNTVQQSSYARLFSVLPIGILGLAGYSAIASAWIVSRVGCGAVARLAPVALLVLTLIGTLFSLYLTVLEPFVIGASCAWCLSSAVIMTTLLWLTVAPGRHAWSQLRHPPRPARRRHQ